MREACKTWQRVALSMFALLSMLHVTGCSDTPDEARLRAGIDEMQAAVQEQRPGDFMQFVTDDFIGEGGMDRAALHNLLRAQLLRNASIGATRGPLDIQIRGDQASVGFSVVLTGGAGGLVPERAQGYSIKTGWRIEDGEWRLFLAEWEPKL